jgi:hypothetical protein
MKKHKFDSYKSSFLLIKQIVILFESFSGPGEYLDHDSIVFFAPAIYSFIEHQEPRVEGMVVLVLPLKELFRDLVDVSIGNSGSLFVLDEKGFYLFHENKDLILSKNGESSNNVESYYNIIQIMVNQKSGFGTYSDREGSQYIFFSPISTVKWSLGVKGSYNEIAESIKSGTPIFIKNKHYKIGERDLFEDVTIYPLSGTELERAVIRMDDVTGKVRMEERGILRMLTSIRESGQRVAGIIDNMLSFSRKSERENSSNNIGELIDKTLFLASSDYILKKKRIWSPLRSKTMDPVWMKKFGNGFLNPFLQQNPLVSGLVWD